MSYTYILQVRDKQLKLMFPVKENCFIILIRSCYCIVYVCESCCNMAMLGLNPTIQKIQKCASFVAWKEVEWPRYGKWNLVSFSLFLGPKSLKWFYLYVTPIHIGHWSWMMAWRETITIKAEIYAELTPCVMCYSLRRWNQWRSNEWEFDEVFFHESFIGKCFLRTIFMNSCIWFEFQKVHSKRALKTLNLFCLFLQRIFSYISVVFPFTQKYFIVKPNNDPLF